MSQPSFEASPAPTVLTKRSAWNVYTVNEEGLGVRLQAFLPHEKAEAFAKSVASLAIPSRGTRR